MSVTPGSIQLARSGLWLAAVAGIIVAVASVVDAQKVVPLLDAADIVIEPIIRNGSDYFGDAQNRTFFRPIEYFLNLAAYNSGNLWITLVSIVLLVATMAVILARLANPTPEAQGAWWRWVTAALIFTHPLILASEFEYDRVSQALANLMGVVAIATAVKRPRAIWLLLIWHVIGLASKESYATFMALSSVWAFYLLLRSREYRRAAALICGCFVLAIAYRWVHLHTTNELLLADTPRYHLGLGANALRNLALFLCGSFFFGSSASAAQGLSWRVLAWFVLSASFWTLFALTVVRAARRGAGGVRVLIQGLEPLYLGALAALFPAVLMQDVSENNASCFAAFFIATAMALMHRAMDATFGTAEIGVHAASTNMPRVSNSLAAVTIGLSCVCCATASIDKLTRLRATSADAISMAEQAKDYAGQGRIWVSCRYVPRHKYSNFYSPSADVLVSVNRYLLARGEIGPGDVIRCAPR